MATLQQDVFAVKHLAYHGNPGGDTDIEETLVKHWIQYYRDMSIVQFYQGRPREVDALMYQQLGCLELEFVDMAECPCIDITWDCKVAKVEIPKPITLGEKQVFQATYINRLNQIDILPVNRVRNQRHARFTGRKDVGVLAPSINDGKAYLYIYTDNDDLLYISGRGVFADPTIVINHIGTPTNCTQVCFNEMTDQYPMSGSIRAMVYAMIIERELKMTLSTVEDIINNSQDDPTLMAMQRTLQLLDKNGDRRQSLPGQSQAPSIPVRRGSSEDQ